MCTLALKEVVKYYTSCRGSVYCCLYIDVLLERLESSGVGSHIGHEYLGSLCSADDLALLAPTVFSLRRMLKICEEFSVEYDIIFNAKKTVCILFSGRHGSRTPPVMSLNGTVLHWKDTIKHLGNFMSNDLSEDEEIRYKQCDFIGRVNSVCANFKSAPRDVVSKIFTAQCCHLYGCQAWARASINSTPHGKKPSENCWDCPIWHAQHYCLCLRVQNPSLSI